MLNAQLREGRVKAGLTQVQAAARLNVSQPYLSQLEKGERPVTTALARSAAALYRLSPTVLPKPETVSGAKPADPARLARQLGSLGYPGFSHLHSRSRVNPATVVVEALLQNDLEVRLSEALPWVLLEYSTLDWPWLVRNAKEQDVQNRLGFLVATALFVAANKNAPVDTHERLSTVLQQLERARLVREDTLCQEAMPAAERRWLRENRPALARHWNLLTSLSTDQLSYAA